MKLPSTAVEKSSAARPSPMEPAATGRSAPAGWVAVAGSALLHLAALALLLGWRNEVVPPEPVSSVQTRLIALPPAAPAQPAPAAVVSSPALPTAMPPPPRATTPPPAAAPVVPEPAADLARQRQERERAQQQQQAREQRAQQQREEQQAAAREAEAIADRAAEQARLAAQARAAADAQAAAEAAYQPLAKTAPTYPARALQRRIEGDCTVRYTVGVDGAVENPEVVGECHPLFVVPSLAAARRFLYQPRIVDGRAVAVAGVTNTFHYRVQEQGRE